MEISLSKCRTNFLNHANGCATLETPVPIRTLKFTNIGPCMGDPLVTPGAADMGLDTDAA